MNISKNRESYWLMEYTVDLLKISKLFKPDLGIYER